MANIRQKSSSFLRFLEKHWLVFFIALIFLSVIVRLLSFTKSSTWHDEGFSILLSSRNWEQIWLGSARDVHPPLYYELLHGWSAIFGKSITAIRSMSLFAGILIVALSYKIVYLITRRYNVALFAGFLVAINPFLIRYSQEARMYGVLGVFLLLAIVGIILIVQNKNNWLGYVLYVFGVSAGLYTHYFTALAVVSFWAYIVLIYFSKNKIKLLFDWKWWVSNILALAIFLPWIPSMIAQFTRAQGLGWLSKTSLKSLNDTVWQFFTFTDARQIFSVLYWLVPIILIAVVVYLGIKDRSKEKFSVLLLLFTFLPIILAIAVSFIKPIFHERYFAFSAIGFSMLLALAIQFIFRKNKNIGVVFAIIIILMQFIGIRNVYSQSNHQMNKVMEFVNSHFANGDNIIAGELYVYFDGTYYNKTNKQILLYTGNGRPNGYGESGLIYDKNVYLDNYNEINNGRVWIVGKTGSHSYYDNVPMNWKLVKTESAGYSEARLYQIQ